MIIQARMENIFNFLSSCDTFHMSARFLLKPLAFLSGLSVLFVFPQKNPYILVGSRGRTGGSVLVRQEAAAFCPGHAYLLSYLPSPCNTSAAES